MNDENINRTVLILTATVNPKNMPGAIADPVRRLADYVAVFRYYLDNHPALSKIVFVENSGWPLDALYEAGIHNPFNKSVEYISLNENDFPREFGKGFGEHTLLVKAVAVSKLIAGAEYFAKMTGRHYLVNLTEILKNSKHPFDVLCDFRDHPLYEITGSSRCGRHCDTRFIVFRKEFFVERFEHLTEGHCIGEFSLEAQYYRALKPLDDGERVICRFPVEPLFRGTAGHWGKDYSGWKERLKQGVRRACRNKCPWLRI
jgi:hypothetical protein